MAHQQAGRAPYGALLTTADSLNSKEDRAFARTCTPPTTAAGTSIDFPTPLTPVTQKTSLEFYTLLNVYLRFCPTHPSEQALMDRFANIGVGAGQTFDASKLLPETKQAIEAGIADAWAEFKALLGRTNKGEVTSGDAFGARECLKNNYLYRMGAAVIGNYALSKEEAIHLTHFVDGDGQKLNGINRYALRFEKGQLPPANSFWSLTLYDQPASLLVANPINRYLLNSTMLSQFKMDDDGGLALHVLNESPGKDREANWLPSPKGPFWVVLRLYWPKAEALEGKWIAPPLNRNVGRFHLREYQMQKSYVMGLLLAVVAGANLSAQTGRYTGRWVNVDVDAADQGLFVLVFEASGHMHQLMPAPQFQGTYAFVAGRVAMRMGDGSADSSFVFRGDSLVQAREPAIWTRVSGPTGPKGSVQGTWAPVGPAPMETFMTLRSDGEIVLEVGFPVEATMRADTLRLTSTRLPATSYTLRQLGDTLHVLDIRGKERRFVRRPWGCLGIGTFDVKAAECRN